MKTLNQKNNRMLTLMFGKFLTESDVVKKTNLQNEIIAKFGIEHFESKMKSIPKILSPANVPAEKENKAVETLLIESGLDAPIISELLLKLNAIGIKDRIIEGGKSIFKKDFNNKTDRTQCRNKFQNAISVYLLHLAHNKKELADAKLNEIKEIAKKYYLAEIDFKNKNQYCTDNMQADKKALIDLFISEYNKSIVIAE